MTTTPARPALAPTTPGTPPRQDGWTPGRTVAAVASALFLVLGSLLTIAGVGVVLGASAVRGDDGLYSTTTTTWSTPGYAVQSQPLYLHRMPMMPGAPGGMMGTVRITARSNAGHGMFIGLARADDVAGYLGRVPRSTFAAPWEDRAAHFDYADGLRPGVAPTSSRIWVASASGPGTQSLTWTPRAGDWRVVVMNSDGSAPVSADVRFAAELPVVNATAITLLITGVVLIVASSAGVWLALPRSRHRPSTRSES